MGSRRIVIAGGGAAGFFAAIACAEADPTADVQLHEATDHPLAKVRVSGGGRCNVTHACFESRELVTRYPRGGRELRGPLTRFGPADTVAWFAARGIELKTEADGRMFPVTDDSDTIVNCLESAAAEARVRVFTRSGLKQVERDVPGALGLSAHPKSAFGSTRATFQITFTTGEQISADRLLLATGGTQGSAGLTIAQALGHTIEPPVPSLFTFNVADPRLQDLAGLSVPFASASVRGTKLCETGPLLITHWGLSGPAILKLSAWGARELHAAGYRFSLAVNWVAPRTLAQTQAELAAYRTANPKRRVATGNPFGVPARLWERLAAAAGFAPDAIWSRAANSTLTALAAQLAAAEFAVTGKSTNKEEFVTCGGVRLREVDFATMESRVCPGLYFAGEVLDIDGVTGGFNFQSAWTTGWHAGRALAG